MRRRGAVAVNARIPRLDTNKRNSERIKEETVTDAQFAFEFYSGIPDPDDALWAEAEKRLVALATGHDDLVGASVTMEELTGGTTPYRYQATVAVFKRPDNVAATEKAESPEGALKGALSAAVRQVRELRERLRETWT